MSDMHPQSWMSSTGAHITSGAPAPVIKKRLPLLTLTRNIGYNIFRHQVQLRRFSAAHRTIQKLKGVLC